jgi:hypothetical protein
MLRHALRLGLAAVVAAVPDVVIGQDESPNMRRLSAGLGLGGAHFTTLQQASRGAPVTREGRTGLTGTATASVRLHPQLSFRADVTLSSTRARDAFDMLGAFASFGQPIDDDRDTDRQNDDLDRRVGTSALTALSPLLEWRVTAGGSTLLRIGPSWLYSESILPGGALQGSLASSRSVTASGWGLRAGLSSVIGGPNSPLSVSADVIRVTTASGPLMLVPVSVGVRLW